MGGSSSVLSNASNRAAMEAALTPSPTQSKPASGPVRGNIRELVLRSTPKWSCITKPIFLYSWPRLRSSWVW